MTPREHVLAAIAHDVPDRVPLAILEIRDVHRFARWGEGGGYICGPDHGARADVPYENLVVWQRALAVKVVDQENGAPVASPNVTAVAEVAGGQKVAVTGTAAGEARLELTEGVLRPSGWQEFPPYRLTVTATGYDGEVGVVADVRGQSAVEVPLRRQQAAAP